MNRIELKYGVAAFVQFPLYSYDEPRDGIGGLTLEAGDVHLAGFSRAGTKILDAASTNVPVVAEGWSYALELEVGELEVAVLQLLIQDQSDPKLFADSIVTIDTYGHASARHVFDRDAPGIPLGDVVEAFYEEPEEGPFSAGSMGEHFQLLAREATVEGVETKVDSIDADVAATLSAVADIAPIKAVTDDLDTMMEDASGFRFTLKALELAPTGGSAAAVWEYATRELTGAVEIAEDGIDAAAFTSGALFALAAADWQGLELVVPETDGNVTVAINGTPVATLPATFAAVARALKTLGG